MTEILNTARRGAKGQGSRWRWLAALVLQCLTPLFAYSDAHSQQFNSDNQWVAPHGVGTLVVTGGEKYSSVLAVAALLREWEFNLGVTYYYQNSEGLTDDHATSTFYVKHRLRENEHATGGMAFLAGTGVDRSHLESGTKTDTFRSWWGNFVYTVPFRDGKVTLDMLPGFLLNLDKDNTDHSAWGTTYSSRAAFYGVIPKSAIVAEVFGTAGEAYSDPKYRVGVRWESEKLILAASYSEAFDGSGGAGFELGLMYLTKPRFCVGGCGH